VKIRLATVAAAAAFAALAAAGPSLGDSGGNGNGQGRSQGNPHVQSPAPVAASVQGVVQSVWSTGALVKLLDGSTVTVALGKDTQVVVDGRPSKLSAVRPGYVLVGVARSGHTTILRFVRPT
jgi:hypothetical protein